MVYVFCYVDDMKHEVILFSGLDMAPKCTVINLTIEPSLSNTVPEIIFKGIFNVLTCIIKTATFFMIFEL